MILDQNIPVARLVAVVDDDPVVRLHRLAAAGKIRIPNDFGKPWDLDPVRPLKGEYVGALDALLEEHEADR